MTSVSAWWENSKSYMYTGPLRPSLLLLYIYFSLKRDHVSHTKTFWPYGAERSVTKSVTKCRSVTSRSGSRPIPRGWGGVAAASRLVLRCGYQGLTRPRQPTSEGDQHV